MAYRLVESERSWSEISPQNTTGEHLFQNALEEVKQTVEWRESVCFQRNERCLEYQKRIK